jgi:tetratricopeptide (TPR) repeat protein
MPTGEKEMRSLYLLAVIVLFATFANAQSTQALQIFEKAVYASKNGDHRSALEGFRSTLSIIERETASDTFFAKVHYDIGVSHYHLRDLGGATEHFAKALSHAKQKYSRAQYALGLTLLEANDLENAEQHLRNAVVLDNRNAGAWYDLSRVYYAANEGAKAKRALARALKLGAVVRVSEPAGASSVATLTAYE